MTGLRLVSIDRLAVEPISPIKPKKSLIIALGLILGGVVGSLIVLLRYAFKMRRYERARIAIAPMPSTFDAEVNSPPLVVR
nr:GNVR domain-containing protein [Pseudomonas sp. Hg5Tf]